MGRVKIFTTRRCPKCPQAHKVGELLKERGVKVEFFDLETPDGLAEAAFYSVQSTPTILVEDDHERVLAHWIGWVPRPAEVEEVVQVLHRPRGIEIDTEGVLRV